MADRNVDRFPTRRRVGIFYLTVLTYNVVIHEIKCFHRAILAFAAFHIYLAATLPLPFVIYYVCALAIPLFLLLSAVAIVYESTHNIIQKTFIGIKTSLMSCKGKASLDEETQPARQDSEGEQAGESSTTKDVHSTSDATPVVGSFSPVALHLHHWQIFYVLSFFTR